MWPINGLEAIQSQIKKITKIKNKTTSRLLFLTDPDEKLIFFLFGPSDDENESTGGGRKYTEKWKVFRNYFGVSDSLNNAETRILAHGIVSEAIACIEKLYLCLY